MAKKKLLFTIIGSIMFLFLYFIGFVVVVKVSMNANENNTMKINTYDDLAKAYESDMYGRIQVDEFESLGYITISVDDSSRKLPGKEEVYTEVFVTELYGKPIYLIDYFTASVEDNKDNEKSFVTIDKIEDIDIINTGYINLNSDDFVITYEPLWGQAVVLCFLYAMLAPVATIGIINVTSNIIKSVKRCDVNDKNVEK